jgi:hypothetical protein
MPRGGDDLAEQNDRTARRGKVRVVGMAEGL